MDKCSVLAYHRIEKEKRDSCRMGNVLLRGEFERQAAYLKKNFTILSLGDFLLHLEKNKDFPSRSVLLTFDDGQADFYQNAFPILKSYKIPAAVFLATRFIGTGERFWWDELMCYLSETGLNKFKFRGRYFDLEHKIRVFNELVPVMQRCTLLQLRSALDEIKGILEVRSIKEGHLSLGWSEIKEMSREGISFGAHTHSHINLAKTPYEEARKEILLSKDIIQDRLKEKIESFAYPYGGINDFDGSHGKILKESGFKIAFTAVSGRITKNSDFFRLGRINISGIDNFLVFKSKVRGTNRIILKAISILSNGYN